jgi:hypothetical protein
MPVGIIDKNGPLSYRFTSLVYKQNYRWSSTELNNNRLAFFVYMPRAIVSPFVPVEIIKITPL